MKKLLLVVGLVLFLNSCGPNSPLVEYDPKYTVYEDARGLSIRNSLYNATSIPYAKVDKSDFSWSMGLSNSSLEEARIYSLIECNRRLAKVYIDPNFIVNGNKCYIINENETYENYSKRWTEGKYNWIMPEIAKKNKLAFEASLKQQTKKQEQISELNSISGEEKKIKTCENYGFIKGTEEFGKCIFNLMELELEYSRLDQEQSQSNQSFQLLDEQTKLLEKERKLQRDLEISRRMIELGNILGTSNNSGTINNSREICIKMSESISGTNKICNYNCPASGGYAMTIRSHQVCSPSTTK